MPKFEVYFSLPSPMYEVESDDREVALTVALAQLVEEYGVIYGWDYEIHELT